MADSYTEESKTELNDEINKALDNFGVCAGKARELNYLRVDVMEILSIVGPSTPKVCGSTGDSSFLSFDEDMLLVISDTDCMIIGVSPVVYNDRRPPGATYPDYVSTYYFDTTGTHVGYGRLRPIGKTVTNGAEFFSSENVAENLHLHHASGPREEGQLCTARHGPSSHISIRSLTISDWTKRYESIKTDSVLGLPFKDGWPLCVRAWFQRERKHGWPSDEIIEAIKKDGCHLVPVGHKKSCLKIQRDEWRVSTVLAERTLVRSFNDTQHKAYLILKFIKTNIAKKTKCPNTEEEILTSYHIKTLMLWMIHDTPSKMWQNANLIQCIEQCLEQLHMWFDEGCLPLYFIPDNNLIDALSGEQCRRISNELSIIRKNLTTTLQVLKNLTLANADSWIFADVLVELGRMVPFFVFWIDTEDPIRCANLQKYCHEGVYDKSVGEHMSRILEQLHRQTKGCIQHVNALKYNQACYFEEAEGLLQSSVSLDKTCNRLKLANFYYTWGKTAKDTGNATDAARHFKKAKAHINLALKEENLKYYILEKKRPWYSPHDREPQVEQSRRVVDLVKQESSLDEGRDLILWVLEKRKFCWPVCYPPSFLCTLPKEIQYVLYAASRKPAMDSPYIHPLVFGTFLAILIANETCDESRRETEVDPAVWSGIYVLQEVCLNYRVCLGFERAVAYTLLGQCFMLINNQLAAKHCFITSYLLWPTTTNCAIWLLCKMYFVEMCEES